MIAKERSLNEIAADIKATLAAAGPVGTPPRGAKEKPKQPTQKRGLPNQHGRLSRELSVPLSFTAGACPSCSMMAAIGDHHFSPIYQRSETSVTFRCRLCGLKWTVTLANLHKIASARKTEHSWYKLVAIGTSLRLSAKRNTNPRSPGKRTGA